MIDKETIKQNINRVLNEHKKKSGKSKREILLEAGIKPELFFPYISDKRREISPMWIASICQTLNISTDEILLKRSEGE